MHLRNGRLCVVMMPAELLRSASHRLDSAGVPSAQHDAQLLWQHSQYNVAEFERLLAQREQRIPLQHITGVAYFRHLTLRVGPGVFTPRPETELLAQVAIDELLLKAPDERVAVELCAGSGAVALAIATEVPHAVVHAVELSPDAFRYLQENVAGHSTQLKEMQSTITIYLGDATEHEVLAHLSDQVQVVVCNPPYIPDAMIPREPEVLEHDPHMALFGGLDGFDIARGVISVAQTLLSDSGVFGMEHADVQGQSIHLLFDDAWQHVVDHQDYNQRARYVTARLRPMNPDSETMSDHG